MRSKDSSFFRKLADRTIRGGDSINQLKCPKCKGEMEEGHLELRSGIWWKQNKSGLLNNLTTVGGNMAWYRCVKCGYLESYAK